MNKNGEPGSSHLAAWVVRLTAKGESLRGQRRSDLRQVAIVTCAKSVAEVALFNEQKSMARRNIGLNIAPNNQQITRLRRKRFYSSGHHPPSMASSTCSEMSMDISDSTDSCPVIPSSCSCNRCSLCRPPFRKQASVLRSRSPSPSSTPPRSISRSSSTTSDSLICDKGSWDDESEESKLIDEFLASLSSYDCAAPPSSKRQKRL